MRTHDVALAHLRARRRGGFSLVEIAMVLAIVALLVAGVMLFFANASNAQKTNDAMSELANLQQVVHSVYAGQPDYTGLDESLVAASKQVPAKWVKGTGLVDPFASGVTIAAANSNANFAVTMTGVPQASCSKMTTMDFGTGLVALSVNGGTAVAQRAMTPSEANTNCSSNINTIEWTFF